MTLFLLETLACVLYLFFMSFEEEPMLKQPPRGRPKVPMRTCRETIQGKDANSRASVLTPADMLPRTFKRGIADGIRNVPWW